MPNITTCTRCGRVYEAGSEEAANETSMRLNDNRARLCPRCCKNEQPTIAKAAAPLDSMIRWHCFTLSGGHIVTDTVTGDRFALAGIVCRPTGAIEYDPTRLDALARRIVDLLNEHGS